MSAGVNRQLVAIAPHCVLRYRQRIGPETLPTEAVVDRIVRAIHNGRIATAKEARAIIEHVGHVYAPGSLSCRRQRTRYVLYKGAVYVIQEDRFRPGGLVAITCWGSPLERHVEK